MDTPTRDPRDPRGVCGTCRFFIDDPEELGQELKFITQSGVHLTTTERKKKANGFVDGAKVERAFHNYNHMEAAFARLGFTVAEVGLCEKGGPDSGPARFVHRMAGSTKTCSPCSKWREKGPLITLRPPGWREKRERLIRAGEAKQRHAEGKR
jgi:hypothetical protein